MYSAITGESESDEVQQKFKLVQFGFAPNVSLLSADHCLAELLWEAQCSLFLLFIESALQL